MNFLNHTVLVTGANGWLGRRLVRALTRGNPDMDLVGAGGARVRALVKPGENAFALSALGVEVVSGDLRDDHAVRAFMRGAQDGVLFHLAGVIHPKIWSREFVDINLKGTQAVVTAAGEAGVRRAVVISSNSPIGGSQDSFEVFDEDSPYRPYMGYGHSKRLMEEWLRSRIVEGTAPEIVIIRAPWFYGPEQPDRQSRFFSMIKAGRFPLMGNGGNRRSMAYIDSLVYGTLLAAAAEKAAGQIYWIADERAYRMKEIVDTVRDVLREDFGMSVKSTTTRLPAVISDFARIADWAIQAAGLYNQEIHVLSEMNLTIACSIDKAKREIGYRPLVYLREGMRRSIAWCLENGIQI